MVEGVQQGPVLVGTFFSIVDNCKQDLGPAGLVTFFAWARLWLASPSDVLIVLSYAPKQSFRNFVELLFGWVSQRLAGHCFSDDKDVARTQMKNVVDGVRDGFPVQCHLPDDAGRRADYDTVAAFCKGRIVPSAKRRSLRRFMVNSSFSWHIVIGATIFYLLGGVVFPPALACGIIQAYRRCLLHACNKWVKCCRAQSLTPSTQATTPRGSKWRMMPRCGRRPMSTSPRPC